MTETTRAIIAGFRETADRLLRGSPLTGGETIGLAITASYIKTGIVMGMIEGVTLDEVARVEQALRMLDEPKVEGQRQWN